MSDKELQKFISRMRDCTALFKSGINDAYTDRLQLILLAEILLELRELREEKGAHR